MQPDECFQLGYVIKKHGLNGGVTVFLDVDAPEEYNNLESVFVEINQKLIPFFIENISIKGNKANIKFEEVDSAEQAEELRSCSLYLPLTALPDLEEGQFYYHQVVGYKAFDTERGKIGTITGVLTGPQQDLFAIEARGKEVLVPINDELILKVDHESQRIDFELPDGLLDIYLN